MSWDKGKPIAGRKARYVDDDIRANNDAIEAAIHFGHDFATGSTQTGEHNDGSAKIYSAAAAPTTKEDGVTALDSDDVGKRLWYDTGNSLLKVLTAIGSPNTWTSIAQLMGMLDEDDMASDSDELPATQQSIKTYVDTLVNGLDAGNIKKDGSVAFTDNQSMGNKKLTDLADPEANQDAATKKYVDDQINAKSFGSLSSVTPETAAAGVTATEDGFVIAYLTGTNIAQITAAINGETVLISENIYFYSAPNTVRTGLTLPVKAGETWKITVSNGTPIIRWRPIY